MEWPFSNDREEGAKVGKANSSLTKRASVPSIKMIVTSQIPEFGKASGDAK
jgi:hypothetical protein